MKKLFALNKNFRTMTPYVKPVALLVSFLWVQAHRSSEHFVELATSMMTVFFQIFQSPSVSVELLVAFNENKRTPKPLVK